MLFYSEQRVLDDSLLLAGLKVFAIGAASSLHPCPLMLNLAALGVLSSWSKNTADAFKQSALYLAGYVTTYLSLVLVIYAFSLTVSPWVTFLQEFMDVIFGPLLIFVGMIQLKLIGFSWTSDRATGRLKGLKAFPMGALLALFFCPATAAIFFGVLIPICLSHPQAYILPLIYAIAVTLPIVVMVVISVFSRELLQPVAPERFFKWVPKISGILLIGGGLLLCWGNTIG